MRPEIHGAKIKFKPANVDFGSFGESANFHMHTNTAETSVRAAAADDLFFDFLESS